MGGNSIFRMAMITLLVIAAPVDAQQHQGRSFSWMGEISGSRGGDRLYELIYTDGSTQSLDAGDGFTFSGGILQHLNQRFGVKYALGFKFNESNDEQVTIRTTTFPVDIVPYVRGGNHRLGLGLTYHLKPKIDDDLLGDVRFDDGLGAVAEYSYSWFTVAYTAIDYSYLGTDIDASHFSIRATFAF